jgi:transposase-like protein
MKTYKSYSVGFKEQALVKVYSRSNDQTIEMVANELNINVTTLKDWMKQSKKASNKTASPTSKRPMDWRPEERLTALQQSYSLLGEDLNTWCRERGVFAHQLEQWKIDFCSHDDIGGSREDAQILRVLKVENQSLERELLRKDKALAEAAALLVLQKKFRALLGGEVE